MWRACTILSHVLLHMAARVDDAVVSQTANSQQQKPHTHSLHMLQMRPHGPHQTHTDNSTAANGYKIQGIEQCKEKHTSPCDAIRAKEQREELKKKNEEEENEETHFGDIMGWCLLLLWYVVACARTISVMGPHIFVNVSVWTGLAKWNNILPTFFLLWVFFFSEHTPIESPFCSVASASATLTSLTLTRFIYVVCLLCVCVDAAIA